MTSRQARSRPQNRTNERTRFGHTLAMALGERAKPLSADNAELYLGTRRIACLVCEGTRFDYREILMKTSGMLILGLDWANKVGFGAVCCDCGYVHTFLDPKVELRVPEEDR